MAKASSAETLQRLNGVKKYTSKELTYKNIGCNGSSCLIDCFKDGVLLMTYRAYYNHRTGDYTLYPSVNHRFDPRIPGKHNVHVTQMK